MFEVTVEQTFAAGHALAGVQRASARTFTATITRFKSRSKASGLNRIGLLVDFVELKRVVREVVDRLDHQFINDLEPFTSSIPRPRTWRSTSTTRCRRKWTAQMANHRDSNCSD